ncbi:MAG: hypothetical protein B7Z59_14050 [Acidiphilium sp. 37-67-22]|nr:MAG: hypothetical protein B7X09_06075 [Acidiphilium sp. 21-66-27]OYW04985.1 MAG: hypothetical protein B7Z59_14050 [Acidiphilium sp. 37-67-22]
MTKLTRTIALIAALGAIAPAAANAANFGNTHDQLVQKINNAYGTQFKTGNTAGQTAPAEAQHNN